jgi:hypothetical protein
LDSKNLLRRHCEERSDAAISICQAKANYEIASLRSQRRLSRSSEAIILKRAVEPQNAQKSHKNQVHEFWKYLTDLVIPEIVSTSCFIYVTYVLSVADCRL